MQLETTIHTIRHAHTDYNAEKRYAGTIDAPLSEAGIRDALEASARLAGRLLDVVITSTLRRAVDTAHLLVGDSVPIVQCELCNERSFGILEGLTWDEAQQVEPRVLFVQVGNDLHSVNPKGGEPFEVVWDRAKRFHQLIRREYGGRSVLVVSHGVFLQMFHGVLRSKSCIESLATYPSNLELASFRFRGNHLVQQTVLSLDGAKGPSW